LVKSVGECTISSLAVLDKLDGAFAWKRENKTTYIKIRLDPIPETNLVFQKKKKNYFIRMGRLELT
jgi:hypothetical protein